MALLPYIWVSFSNLYYSRWNKIPAILRGSAIFPG